MKVVLLTSEQYLAAGTAVKEFLEENALVAHNVEVVGIVAVPAFDFSVRSFSRMWKFLERSGVRFFSKIVFSNIWQNMKLRFASWFFSEGERKNFSVAELADKYGIPYFSVSDINSQEVYDFIRSKRPDYLASCLLLQLIKAPVLSLPKKGSINFHPALTQKHRGVMCGFWAILNKWRRSGATIHYMTKRVDEGKVILQKRFFIKASDSIYCISQKSAKIGGKLLVKALVKLKRRAVKGRILKKLGRVFTFPDYKAVRKFFNQKREVIRWRQVFEL